MDINELVNGMELTRREYEARKDRDPPAILNEFLANSEDKLTKLRADVKTAQVGAGSISGHARLDDIPLIGYARRHAHFEDAPMRRHTLPLDETPKLKTHPKWKTRPN